MKKDPALGRRAQSGAEAESEREGEKARKGSRWGSDKPATRKPPRERVVPHRAGLLSPNGHSCDMSDVGQLLFSPLWRRHTEQRDNEVQSSGGKEGQL